MNDSNHKNFGIIILAAGVSSRLGRPKQLLEYDNRTLLEHSLLVARSSDANEIVVVLGAHASAIHNETSFMHEHVVVNPNWQEGMASSIRFGVQSLLDLSPSTEGVILLVCDQPFIYVGLLNELIAAHLSTGKTIIASNYEDTIGTPVFFHRDFFPALLELTGDTGAKKLIHLHTNQLGVISFVGGEIDIDTEEDYLRMTEQGESSTNS